MRKHSRAAGINLRFFNRPTSRHTCNTGRHIRSVSVVWRFDAEKSMRGEQSTIIKGITHSNTDCLIQLTGIYVDRILSKSNGVNRQVCDVMSCKLMIDDNNIVK